MTTEEPGTPRALEPNRASCIDTLKISGASGLPSQFAIAGAASIETEQEISGEPMNWAGYIDRIYLEELMRRLDH